MKKSIVAMLSITALATVANAETWETWEGYYGRNFENKQNGPFLVQDAEDGTLTPYYWYATNLTTTTALGSCVYTNSNYMGAEYNDVRPLIAKDASTTNRCLLVDTEGERLYRTIGGRDAYDGSTFTPYGITTNNTIYFDSLVQFTVNEDDQPTIQTNAEGICVDKLAVWLKADDNGTTNLMITAGFLDSTLSSQNYVGLSNYVVQTSQTIVPGVWHRLTIGAVPLLPEADGGSGYLGFYVYIDGVLVTSSQPRVSWTYEGEPPEDPIDTIEEALGEIAGGVVASIDDESAIFLSLVPQSAAECDALSCVAFEGTGAIDDLTFTDTNPFAVAPSANPTVDGTPLNPADVFFTNGVAAARTDRAITYPSAPVLSGEVGSQKITFGGVEVNVPEYYTATLENTVITLALNTNAIPAIAAATVNAEAKEAIEVDAATFKATLDSTYPNLYYGLKVASAPNAAEANWTRGTLEQGTGSPMQISADKPTVSGGSDPAPAGFFKVYVTDVNE